MADARKITLALRGRWYGRYGLAYCPAHHNTRTPALSLSDGRDGRLLARCHAGCSFPAILDALRGLGLVAGEGAVPAFDPLAEAKARAAERADAEKKARQAERLWAEARPAHGSPAEVYLRGRGITCPLPETLRFHPSCWHGATATKPPALVARVEGADRFALHRTWVKPDGSGKAALDPEKAMLGGCMGGAVRLSDGPGLLVVAEGIETALSLLSGLLDGPATVWAALSAPGIRGLRLPATPGRLIVAADGDAAGRDAAHALATRAHAGGRTVSLLPAPPGLDWNDVLTGRAAA